MIDNSVPIIEVTPKLEGKFCIVLAYFLASLLKFGTVLIALFFYFQVDLFYSFASLLISYIVIGIVRSKIRNSSIPIKQQEYQYNDHAIISWFLVKNYYCKNRANS